jgi:hypothetical protein
MPQSAAEVSTRPLDGLTMSSRFPLPASRFPLPASRFPLPASRFALRAGRQDSPISRSVGMSKDAVTPVFSGMA